MGCISGCILGFRGVLYFVWGTSDRKPRGYSSVFSVVEIPGPAISGLSVAPYRAILRYYRCDTSYCAMLSKGRQQSPKMVRYPPPLNWYLVSHRHICAIPHFATYRTIIVATLIAWYNPRIAPGSIGEGASSLFGGWPGSPENVSCSSATPRLQKDSLLLLLSIQGQSGNSGVVPGNQGRARIVRYPIKQARKSFAILSLQVSRDMKVSLLGL